MFSYRVLFVVFSRGSSCQLVAKVKCTMNSLFYYMHVVSVDIWITTGGTTDSNLTRCFGEAVESYVQESGKDDKRPVLIGFANLCNLSNRDEVKNLSHYIEDTDTDNQQVLLFI